MQEGRYDVSRCGKKSSGRWPASPHISSLKPSSEADYQLFSNLGRGVGGDSTTEACVRLQTIMSSMGVTFSARN